MPNTAQLNEFNRVLVAVNELCGKENSCSIGAVLRLCSSIALGGRPVNHMEIIRICSRAGLLINKKGQVRPLALGLEFLRHNPEQWYEITDRQKQFLAERLFLEGPWQSNSRDFLLNFSPDYAEVTYMYSIVDKSLPVRYNAILSLLLSLGVIQKTKNVLRVCPEYVASVRRLLADKEKLTEDDLDRAIQADRKLGAQAEDAVVKYEKKRLKLLGRNVEADSVLRISQLDVNAGYDIKSFDGERPQLEYDRFIEVKASTGTEVRFYWSNNQYQVAKKLGEHYWIYFIGGFSPSKRNQLVPIMIQNPAKILFELQQLSIETAKYLITGHDDLPLRSGAQEELDGYTL